MNQSIFKSYDIRGVYGKDLTSDDIYKISRAFVEYTKAKKVAICRDARLSSLEIFEALAKGITEQDADVYNLELFPTEFLYFAVGQYDYDAGIMITASHNPKEYNGLKMIRKNSSVINVVRGKDMLTAVSKEDLLKSENKGKINNADILSDFLNHIFSLADTTKIKPLKVVLDAGNGTAGKVLPEIIKRLSITAFALNFEPDGNFPNRPPNPLEKSGSDMANQTIIKENADVAFLFDGDADRIFMMDEKGNMVRADVTLLILAKHFLEKEPKSAISYNLICSKAVPEFIKKWGGIPIRTQVGFVNVREGLLKNNGIMGGEVSGHYCFRDFFYFDSAFISLLILLQVISESGKKVSELAEKLSPYSKSPETNFQVENKKEIIDRIKEKYGDGKQDYLDGVTVEYPDWWFNVRPSNTEPLLRLSIEADTPELLKQKKKELTDFIQYQ